MKPTTVIPFLDLKRLNETHTNDFRKDFERVLASGWYILGEEVTRFEDAFAEYCGTKHAIGVANGLDALTLILRGYLALGKLSPGDEILVPANTYIATWLAVLEAGLTPVPVEPDFSTYNLDLAGIQKSVTPKTKGVLIVHLYGRAVPTKALKKWADEKGLLVIEDSAQSHGAIDEGKRSGALGHASGFSFYPGKNLGALGDAGGITTDDDDLADVLRALRNYGSKVKYVNDWRGMNSRLDPLQAAFLTTKLKTLDTDTDERRNIAAQFHDQMKNPHVTLPGIPEDVRRHVWHLFVVRTEKRDALAAHLKERGIGSLIHYPIPPHHQKCMSQFGHLQFPLTEQIHREVLTLPLYPGLSPAEIDHIVDGVNSFAGG